MHLGHVEDEILVDGYDGAMSALSCLRQIVSTLEGNTDTEITITTKWDGNPAIFVGTHPENGKFFVGTKGAFSKANPRICYTPEDCDRLYGNVLHLAHTLKSALRYLPELGIENRILQGDVMFAPGDIQVAEDLDTNQSLVTFYPNSILYGFPRATPLAECILRAKFGIIFHTELVGDEFHSLVPDYRICLDDLNRTPNVWFEDAYYLDTADVIQLTENESNILQALIQQANQALHHISETEFTQLFSIKTFVQMLKQYQNQMIRGGTHIGCPHEWIEQLPAFVEQKVRQEKIKEESKTKKIIKLNDHIDSLAVTLLKVLEFQRYVVNAKLMIIHKLEEAKTFKTFCVTENGWKAVKQEGFVAVDYQSNKAIKLVDRLDFSQRNFARRS